MGFSAQHPRVRVFSKVHPRPTHKESKPQKSDIFLGFRLNPDQANIYLGDTFAAVHTRCSVHRFELIAVKDNKADLFFDLRNRARWKKKTPQVPTARHSSTQGAREIDGAVGSRRFPPQPFREADPSGLGFVQPNRDPRREPPKRRRFFPSSSTSHGSGESTSVESEAGLRLGTCTPARCTRARRPRISSGRPDQSSRKDSRCVRRPGSRRAPSHRPSPRVPQIRGTTVSTSSHSGRERFPRHLPCTPSPATPTADATRDPQTQVLVVVKDESRHAPIKKLLQEIGYKGANAHASQPRVDRGQPKRDFTPDPRRSLESSVRVARTRTLSGRSARLI